MCRAALLVGLLLLSGCAVGERPTLTNDGAAAENNEGSASGIGDFDGATVRGDGAVSAEASTNPAPTTERDSLLPELAALGDAPRVLISPTGLLVPVLARTGTGYRVLTPCGNEAELVFGQPVWAAEVVLDPGHGGDEKGALGPSGATEAELNLDIARRTAGLLERQGITVALTRTGDYRIPVRNRAAIADQLGAAAFVSIHHNSPTPDPSDGPGTEVFVKAATPESSRLGGLIYEELVNALGVFDVTWASRPDAGVLTVLNDAGENAYGITRYPTTPVALAELAYISNPAEAVVLSTSEYRQTAAEALTEAIVRFLDTAEPGSGFVDKPRLFNPSAETGGTDGCIDPPLT